MLKKCMALLISCLIILNLSACGAESNDISAADGSSGQDNTDKSPSASDGKTGESEQSDAVGNLTSLLQNTGIMYRYFGTEDGFYYMTEDEIELADGGYGYVLMYMDYASCQEIYLCSDTSCQHNTESCTAVFSGMHDDGRIFVRGEYLYYLDRPYDDSGSTVIDMTFGDESQTVDTEAEQAALYRMNKDGSGRERIYSFEADCVVEDVVLSDDNSLYFVTKKIGVSEISTGSYITTSERKIIRVSPDGKSAETVCSLDFDDGLEWDIIGCADNAVVLKTYQYPDGMTDEEAAALDDDSFIEMMKDADMVYASLNLSTGEKVNIYSQSAGGAASEAVCGGYLYTSNDADENILKTNVHTGEQSVLTSLAQNEIYDVLGSMLVCTSYDSFDDNGYYLVETDTGNVNYCGLTNKSLGWSLDMPAMTGDRILVIYDYEYIDNGDGSYEITRYQYGLISLSDFLGNMANYTPIKMVGKGM